MRLVLAFVSGVVLGFVLGRWRSSSSDPSAAPVRLEFHVGLSSEVITMLNIKDNEQVDLSVVAKDAKGAVYEWLDHPVYSLTDPSLGELVVDPADGTRAIFKAGTPGSGQISFSADPNDTPLVAQLDVTVTPGDAERLEINTGAVSPQ